MPGRKDHPRIEPRVLGLVRERCLEAVGIISAVDPEYFALSHRIGGKRNIEVSRSWGAAAGGDNDDEDRRQLGQHRFRGGSLTDSSRDTNCPKEKRCSSFW